MKEKTKFLDKTISTILSWGLPGVVMLILLAASPYAGAAAITSTLAFLGGPLGMIGGILVTIPAMVILSKKGADYIIPKIREDIRANYEKSEIEDFIIKKFGKIKGTVGSVLDRLYN